MLRPGIIAKHKLTGKSVLILEIDYNKPNPLKCRLDNNKIECFKKVELEEEKPGTLVFKTPQEHAKYIKGMIKILQDQLKKVEEDGIKREPNSKQKR